MRGFFFLTSPPPQQALAVSEMILDLLELTKRLLFLV
jgi:hypothetical protein